MGYGLWPMSHEPRLPGPEARAHHPSSADLDHQQPTVNSTGARANSYQDVHRLQVFNYGLWTMDHGLPSPFLIPARRLMTQDESCD